MFRKFFVIFIATILVLGCRQEQPDATVVAPEPEPVTEAPPAPAVVQLEGFSTPESVLYDAEQDVYFVSNINGSPLEADDNGFISRVNAETRQIELKWIDGAAQNVQLNAPKGLAIVGDELWVTDITRVAKFDRRTGAPKGTFNVRGATFLNDLASEAGVFATDSGMKAGPGGDFVGTGTDSIWEVTNSQPKKVVGGKELNRPNGIAVAAGHLWVVSFAGTELYGIDDTTKAKGEVATLPAGSLDGLLILEDGSFLISSWDANTVFRGPATGPFNPVVENVNAPADIGFDAKRNLILVPHFMENRVSLHPLR